MRDGNGAGDISIAAPLYRLPTVTYQNAFPALLADGALSGVDITAVIQYFTEVETLNRGLDQAENRRSKGEFLDLVKIDHSRNLLKAERLVKGADYYGAALQALDRHVR